MKNKLIWRDFKFSRYRYKLERNYKFFDVRFFGKEIKHPYFEIYDGNITIKEGYAWDGATGLPSFLQTIALVRPSLIHDIICQAVDERYLEVEFRAVGDKIFYDLCLEEGINKFKAKIMYFAVKVYGKILYRKR